DIVCAVIGAVWADGRESQSGSVGDNLLPAELARGHLLQQDGREGQGNIKDVISLSTGREKPSPAARQAHASARSGGGTGGIDRTGADQRAGIQTERFNQTQFERIENTIEREQVLHRVVINLNSLENLTTRTDEYDLSGSEPGHNEAFQNRDSTCTGIYFDLR